MNWRGKPLVCHQTIVKLISSTTTAQGLTVQCSLDENEYEKGRKVSDDELGALKLYPAEFCGKWNYTILPRTPRRTAGVRRVVDRVVS